MPLTIIRNDITKMDADAIVNAANPALKRGVGVCGAIFEAAGEKELQRECDAVGYCGVGQAVITSGYRLLARYIVHAVGPKWQGGDHREAQLLSESYHSALTLAGQHGVKSIAFPLISTGVYGYPKEEALQIAVRTIGDFLREYEMEVYLVVFDRQSFSIGEKRFASLKSYVDERYVEARSYAFGRRALYAEGADLPAEQDSEVLAVPAAAQPQMERKLVDIINQLDESFSQMLLRLIDEKGLTDVETYKRANIDRKLFSKIRAAKGYNPSKPTVLALAVALGLNVDETKDLLRRAGYALSHCYRLDIIVEYFIEHENYDIYEINEALFAFNQPILGGRWPL